MRQNVHIPLYKSSIRDHIKTQHPYVCDICLKVFQRECSLTRHVKGAHTHSEEFKCKICHKLFGTSQRLRVHGYVHNTNTPTNARYADEHWRQNRALFFTWPLILSSKKKKKICDICDSRFLLKEYLVAHLMKHSEEKLFLCHKCGKTFKTEKSLYFHLRFHCGYIKPGSLTHIHGI